MPDLLGIYYFSRMYSTKLGFFGGGEVVFFFFLSSPLKLRDKDGGEDRDIWAGMKRWMRRPRELGTTCKLGYLWYAGGGQYCTYGMCTIPKGGRYLGYVRHCSCCKQAGRLAGSYNFSLTSTK